MDPFSFIVSIITVLDATSKVSKHVCTLSRRIHHSPEEVASISWQIAMYRSQLNALDSLESLDNKFSPQDIRPHLNSLRSLRNETEVLLDKIDNKISIMYNTDKIRKARKKFIWALKDAEVVHGLLRKLEAIEYHVQALLLVISMSAKHLLETSGCGIDISF